eukprot:11201238-Lingulodinium_polyedra.AAC.1
MRQARSNEGAGAGRQAQARQERSAEESRAEGGRAEASARRKGGRGSVASQGSRCVGAPLYAWRAQSSAGAAA